MYNSNDKSNVLFLIHTLWLTVTLILFKETLMELFQFLNFGYRRGALGPVKASNSWRGTSLGPSWSFLQPLHQPQITRNREPAIKIDKTNHCPSSAHSELSFSSRTSFTFLRKVRSWGWGKSKWSIITPWVWKKLQPPATSLGSNIQGCNVFSFSFFDCDVLGHIVLSWS